MGRGTASGGDRRRDDGWTPSPPDEVAELGRRLRSRRGRRRFLARAGGLVASLATLGGAVILYRKSRDPAPPEFGGLACPEVQRLAPAYVAGGLDPATRERIRAHVAHCPWCGPMVRDLAAGRA